MIPHYPPNPIWNTDPEAALAEVERRIRDTGHTYLATGQFGALERLPANLADTVDDQIDLSRTNVSDISGLACLPGLKQLTLSKLVTDISTVSAFSELESLSFWFGGLPVDLSPLVACQKLLQLSNVPGLSDLAPLGRIGSLQRLFDLALAEGQAVPQLPKLTVLIAHSLSRKVFDLDLSFLSASSKLEVLYGRDLRGFDLPRRLGALKKFAMTLRDRADFEIVARNPALEELDVSGTDIDDLSAIPVESKVQRLNISKTRVSDVRRLTRLARLQSLKLDETPVEDITWLSDCSSLKRISAAGTRITSLKGWRPHADLWSLDVSNTGFSDLRPLVGTSLSQLSAGNTPLSDLTGISRIRGLVRLFIGGTKVAVIPPWEAHAHIFNIRPKDQIDHRESMVFSYENTPLAESGWKPDAVTPKA